MEKNHESKSSGTGSFGVKEFLFFIHATKFLTAHSFATVVLIGITPLAASFASSSVTGTENRSEFFRLEEMLRESRFFLTGGSFSLSSDILEISLEDKLKKTEHVY